MVIFPSFSKSMNMANPLTVPDQSNSKQTNQIQKNKHKLNSPNSLKVPPCDQSHLAALDVLILIAVVSAFGFLLFPYVKLIWNGSYQVFGVVKYEVCKAPMVYACLGLSVLFALVAIWAIAKCTSRKCLNPNCRGLRNAGEFDIQIETEDCVRNSSAGGVDNWLFELSQDHHKELEAELKKIAPPNGRAVLLFRARCGCSVGKMEVSGPKKARKVKK